MTKRKTLNRRFVIQGGVVAASAGIASSGGLKSAAAASADGVRWDLEADVVIVGSGLAGCVSAIEAREANPNLDILVLEKMSERYAGGNSRVAGQSMFFPTDIDNLLLYRRALDAPNPIPEVVLKVWADSMVSQHSWIRSMMSDAGYQLVAHRYNKSGSAEYPDLPGSSSADSRNVIPVPVTSGVWQAFKIQADRRKIRFEYETPALDLILDPMTGAVRGVVASRAGKTVNVKARRGVVMCAGGFENNLEMHRNYNGMAEAYPLGSPGNTGDGIKMLQRVGADMWHLRNSVISSGMYPAMKFDEFPCAFLRIAPKTSYSWIDVAKDGCRFWNETRDWNATHYHELRHGNWVDASFLSAGPVHMIFDDRTRRTSPLSYGDRRAMTWNNVVERYVWSADNSTEIAKGWIKTASSVSELARLIGKDPARLEETVKQYNRACADGADQQCGREGNTLQPILTPPFHAVGLVPGAICTTGGAKRNELAQVLSTRGTPIPRLYEAGELGSIMGNLYQNGSFLTECIVFGRIAGRNVAKETAWA